MGTLCDYPDLYLDIERTVFEANIAGLTGGAVDWYGGDFNIWNSNYVKVSNSQFIDNTAVEGGAIQVGTGVNFSLRDSGHVDDRQLREAPFLFWNSNVNATGPFRISQSDISNNTGGGIFLYIDDPNNIGNDDFVISDTTISGNRAGSEFTLV